MCPHNHCAVMLTCPAQIRHGLANNDLGQELLPEATERGVSNSFHLGRTLSCCMVEVPDSLLGRGRWQEDDVVPLVPWDSSGEQNGMILCIVGDESHHILNICKTQSMSRLMVTVLPWYQTVAFKAGLNRFELGLPNRV